MSLPSRRLLEAVALMNANQMMSLLDEHDIGVCGCFLMARPEIPDASVLIGLAHALPNSAL